MQEPLPPFSGLFELGLITLLFWGLVLLLYLHFQPL